ncbi:hypothetical protein V5J34_002888 [Endozoicomonas sp. NE35]
MAEKKALLTIEGKELELPVYSGSTGPDVIDVRSLTANGLLYIRPWFCIYRIL